MDAKWIAVILAIVALALAVWCIVRLYTPIAQAQVTGLTDISNTSAAASALAITNAANIAAINDQLGEVADATTNFTSLAEAEVTPAFPLTLDT